MTQNLSRSPPQRSGKKKQLGSLDFLEQFSTQSESQSNFQQQNYLSSEFHDFDLSSENQLFSPLKNSDKSTKIHSPQQFNKSQRLCSDRYIPNRKSSKLEIAFSTQQDQLIDYQKENNRLCDPSIPNQQQNEEYQLSIADIYKAHILGINYTEKIINKRLELSPFQNNNLLKYQDPENLKESFLQPQPLLISNDDDSHKVQLYQRKIPRVPYKVLDAPALQDDFYLNLIDWSSTANVLGVGLTQCVYLWNSSNSKVTKLCDLGNNDHVTSLQFSPKNHHLAIGTNLGETQIWDAVKLKKISVLQGHLQRVGCIAWGGNFLSTGSRDKNIFHRDIRSSNNYVQKITQAHKQEVCGIKWSFDDQYLASGGNDNKLYVWTPPHTTQNVCKFPNHNAAVKALAWSPHQHGLLASGGGTADRTIRFWNILKQQQIKCVDTGSQVCNLIFSKNVNEIVSTQGYSQNQIIVWNYPDMEKLAVLSGHTFRVLYLAMNPEGDTIVTGAGDETLRFWSVFPSNNNYHNEQVQQSKLLPVNNTIR